MWLNNFFPWFTATGKMNKRLAQFENDIEFQNTFMNLLNLTTYAFKWEGLPETCNERFLELCLTLEGRACMVNDPDYGFLTLKAGMDGQSLNMYGEFSRLYAYGWNGFTRNYTAYMQGSDNTDANAVLCRDNDMCYPYYYYLLMATRRLTDSMRSIDVATKKLKTPYFITCDESQYQSVKKILEDVEGNKDSIIVNKSNMPDMFKVLPTSLDSNVLTVLWNSYNNYEGIIKTQIGIETAANRDKKERLLVDEVNADETASDINVLMRLKTRQVFCETVNRVFGLNISVSVRNEVVNGGGEDGGIQEAGGDFTENPGQLEGDNAV